MRTGRWLLLLGLCGGLSLGCGQRNLTESVDLPHGGFDFSLEQPLFGPQHQDTFVAAGESQAAQAIMGPPVTAPPESRSWAVWSAWGHLVATRDEPTWTDWSGTLQTDVGTLNLQRTLAFDRHDTVLAPPDERTVAFESRTRPHFDGLVSRLTSTQANPVFSLDTTAVSVTHAPADVPVLQDLPVPGTTLSTVIISIPLSDAAPCAHALFTARWAVRSSRSDGRMDGRLVGRVFSPEGTLLGHWRGFTGTRKDGTRVLFGKVIDPDGNALALLDGTVDGDNATVDVLLEDGTRQGQVTLPIPAVGSATRRHAAGVATLQGCL